MNYDRAETIAAIRAALKARSGKTWSVTGGLGTAYGWITIKAPPKRCDRWGNMTDADRAELGELLGFGRPVDRHGESVAASTDHRREYVDRAEGRKPSVVGTPYWD